MHHFLDSLTAFGDRITDVNLRFAAAAMAVQLVKTFAVARAWRSVLTAAYPAQEVRYLRIWGAYLIGAGTNALLPLRGGDAVKVIAAKRQIPGSSYPAVASSLVVLLIFDFVAASAFFAWAVSIGALPSVGLLHHRAFDLEWVLDHRLLSIAIGLLALGGGLVALSYAWGHVVRFSDHVIQGLRTLRNFRHYLLHVVPWQALDWCLRITTVMLFLRAFGLPATLHNAALAQITQDLSTALPFSPGGIGTAQALLLYLFRDVASKTGTLAFSVGMQTMLLAVNLALGTLAALALGWRRHLARLQEAEA
jgi:uncharacterized membrane protein YbhN (UPF0104 family)